MGLQEGQALEEELNEGSQRQGKVGRNRVCTPALEVQAGKVVIISWYWGIPQLEVNFNH